MLQQLAFVIVRGLSLSLLLLPLPVPVACMLFNPWQQAVN
jgi:hypothetical protein